MDTSSHPSGFSKILACIAQGTTSDHAVRAAAELARHFDAQLDLLHVTPPVLPASVHLYTLASESIARGHVEQVRATLRAHLSHRHPGLSVGGTPLVERLEVAVGSPAREVIERVRERGYDLVVLGDSGKRRQLDLGGLARALFAKLDCPVWMQVSPQRELRRILAPIDTSPASMAALERAVLVARKVGAHVHALYCFATPDIYYGTEVGVPAGPLPYTIDEMRRADQAAFHKAVEGFDWKGVPHTAEFVDDDAARAILAAQDRYDLIVLGTHGHGALAAALLGSVTWQVLRLAHTPVLTVRLRGGKYALSG